MGGAELHLGKDCYRDSYDDSNLLWKLGLNYWVWFWQYVDKDDHLNPDKAAIVLEEIESREYLLDRIKDRRDRRYLRKKYVTLWMLLRTAIADDEPIRCSN